MDHCLSAENASDLFQIRERSLPKSFGDRMGGVHRNESDFPACDHSFSRYRSASAMTDSAPCSAADAMAAVLMSRSVMMGDFGRKEKGREEEGGGGRELTHLAKQRPKPARLNRARVKPITEEAHIEAEG